MKRTLEWVGTCVELGCKDLEEFDDSSRDITYRTFLRHIGGVEMAGLNRSFGVPIREDWCVSFYKGKWKGKPAVCLMHSSIHHIWIVGKASK